jgi:hypothetical protein
LPLSYRVHITLGGRGEMERAQMPGGYAASVIRLRGDGRVGPDGFIHLLTDESQGVLARLEPVP